MQSTKIPVGSCKEIEKYSKKFLWRDNETKKKIHIVNKSQICEPKEHGGLGLRKLSTKKKKKKRRLLG